MAIPEAMAATVAAPSKEEAVTLGNQRGRAMLGGFVAAHLSHHLVTALLNPLLPLIRDGFALSYAQSGILVSAFSLCSGFSNAPIGLLADRVGSRPVVVAGLLFVGAVGICVAFAADFWQLLALLALMGLIAGSYHAPAASLIARAFPSRVRGMAMGWHITGGHLSFFLTPLLAAWMVSITDTWRTAYLWLGFAPIAVGVALWFLAPRDREPAPEGAGRLEVFRQIGAVVRMIGPLLSMSILFQFVYMALFAFTALYLVDSRGISPVLAAVLFGAPQLAGMVGAPLAGYLSDRIGRRNVILIGLGLMGPAQYAFTIVPNELILLPLIAVGVAAVMRQAITEVLVVDSAPAHGRATVLGSYYLFAQEVSGLGAPLLGLLAGVFGLSATYGGLSLGLAVLSVVVLFARRRL